MQPNEKKIWFPAKRYGWGWGQPVCWQGWAVVIVYAILNAAAVPLAVFLFQRHLELLVAYLAVLTVAFYAVCRLKGEPPRWRWGGK